VAEVDFHEDMKDVSIAMVSTSALLLTILAVVHMPYKASLLVSVCLTALTVVGLYTIIIIGLLEFVLLIVSSREKSSDKREVAHEKLVRYFRLQGIAFVFGLLGIAITVLLAPLF
jgi:hypothetical protein